MLSREAVAAAMALAGVRSGAHVLDLTPAAGLTRAARAAAGAAGRVDEAGTEPESVPPVRYGYAIGVWSDRPAEDVLQSVEEALPALAPYARITIGSSGSLVALVDRLRLAGWTVLHGTSVAYDGARPNGAPTRKSVPIDRSRDLALVAARAPQ
jgi:hypothetical protein